MCFGALVLVHLLYDFHWQGPFIAEMKSKSWFLLGVHALTWALCCAAVLYAFGMLAAWHLPFLFLTHCAIDAWKARHTKLNALGVALWIDQAAHLVSLIAVVCWGNGG